MLDNEIDRLEKESRRADEAAFILNSAVYQEAMERLGKELDALEMGLDTTDSAICADVIRRKQIYEAIKKSLNELIQTGKLAKVTLKQLTEKKPNRFYR